MKKFCIALILGICFIATGQSYAMTRNEANAYIQRSLKNLNTVALRFSQVEGEKINGFLKAQKGNKYYLNYSDRKIYCDSKKIWNYSVKENKVLISNFSADANSFSLENLFFNIANNYSIQEFSKEKKTDLFVLSLKINPATAKKIKIENVKIWLTEDSKIKYISTTYGSDTYKFLISDLAFNPKLSASTFRFIAPKGCKFIDL